MERKKDGFTLIELIVVVSLISLFSAVGLAQYNRFNRRQILDQAVLSLKMNLRQAQSQALAGEKECFGSFDGFLVSFSSQSYTLRSSCAQGGDLGPARVYFYSSSGRVVKTGGPTSVLFRALTGGTNLATPAVVELSGFGQKRIVTITPTGEIK